MRAEQANVERADTLLTGGRLVAARVVALVASMVVILLTLAAIPSALEMLGQPCSGECAFGQLSSAGAQKLAALGVSLHTFAASSLVLLLIILFVWWAVAAVIFWRKSDDWMALLIGTMLVAQGSSVLTELLYNDQEHLLILNQVSWALFGVALYLFPGGNFVPRWTRWAALLLASTVPLGIISIFSPNPILEWFIEFRAIWLFFLASILISQVYRYRVVSNPVQRLQTKWVVYGVSVYAAGAASVLVATFLFPELGRADSLYSLLVSLVIHILALLIPLSFGLAILRSRLWDIDLLINRTIVYGLLTGALAAIYVTIVVTLQALFSALFGFGRGNGLAVVISTLVIAALFLPLRGRIQGFIDRRFYRQKYDAAQTLLLFSETIRNEVDLDALTAQLLTVVDGTVQPAHASLWIHRRPAVRRQDVT